MSEIADYTPEKRHCYKFFTRHTKYDFTHFFLFLLYYVMRKACNSTRKLFIQSTATGRKQFILEKKLSISQKQQLAVVIFHFTMRCGCHFFFQFVVFKARFFCLSKFNRSVCFTCDKRVKVIKVPASINHNLQPFAILHGRVLDNEFLILFSCFCASNLLFYTFI